MARKISLKARLKSWARIWHANLGIAGMLTLGAIAISCPFIAHKGDKVGVGKALKNIHFGEFLPAQYRWIWIDSQGFILLFVVASGWFIHHRAVKKAAQASGDDPSAPGSSVTILWESGSRDAEAAARQLAQAAEEKGMRAFATDSRRYALTRLPEERWLVCVLSGQNTAPPIQLNGEKLPRLEYAILGADDAGAARCMALDEGLKQRGARPFVPPGRLAKISGDPAWREDIVQHLKSFTTSPAVSKTSTDAARKPELATR
jgi:sulfite reductase alpha subunit-like flavoprotein